MWQQNPVSDTVGKNMNPSFNPEENELLISRNPAGQSRKYYKLKKEVKDRNAAGWSRHTPTVSAASARRHTFLSGVERRAALSELIRPQAEECA